MDIKANTFPALSLDAKTLIEALAVESFNFRHSVHVNVVTTATDPSICVFIYVNGRCEKSITVFLTDADAVEQLEAAYNTVRNFKKQGALPQSNLKLAG
ncbi:hypothetical protein [Pseudoalteromonas sp. TB41]|uniref:hypothetical protein n=1 Tax=Pseudoalteromonas sp. TB41 TaxID=985149 RepID=UPI000416AC58|nr:hypothetical protein [Pseudoalteromonas sp. TB41]